MRVAVGRFLSCLFGSERVGAVTHGRLSFLSCLFGSEPGHAQRAGPACFLSCLFGSEPLWRPVRRA